ncbi:MAG: polysaccharide deacetylase family protein [Candidatus Omnitrophota bacterium]
MGIITLAFDDGYKETFANCAEYLTKKGIRATFALPSSSIGKTLENRTVVDKNDIRYLIKNSHEIASHTTSHRNLLGVYNSEGEDAVKKEMTDSKNELRKLTGESIDSMVFPFIKDNQNAYLRLLASEYYKSSRITSEKAEFNCLPVEDAFSVTGVAFTREISIGGYNKMVDIVSEKDIWLIEVFHLVSDKNTKSAHREGPYRFFTHIDDFKAHLEYIISKKISFLTQKEAILEHERKRS